MLCSNWEVFNLYIRFSSLWQALFLESFIEELYKFEITGSEWGFSTSLGIRAFGSREEDADNVSSARALRVGSRKTANRTSDVCHSLEKEAGNFYGCQQLPHWGQSKVNIWTTMAQNIFSHHLALLMKGPPSSLHVISRWVALPVFVHPAKSLCVCSFCYLSPCICPFGSAICWCLLN